MILRISKEQTIETDNHSLQDLNALRDLLVAENADLREQIHRLAPNSDPIRADSLFIRKKRNGTIIQKLNIVISDRRKMQNIDRNNALTQAFVHLAYQRLPKDLFDVIMHDAQELAQKEGPSHECA